MRVSFYLMFLMDVWFNQRKKQVNMNGNGNIMGMRGIRVGMRRIRVRMQEIRVIFVRIFVIIASAKLPAREGRISPSSCYWQLPNY